jgi:arylformamidase
MSRIYDISRTIGPRTAVWPGDPGFHFRVTGLIAEGSSVNITRFEMSPHTATHADAPWHVYDTGLKTEGFDLSKFIGPAQVISIARQSGPITVAEVQDQVQGPVERLLFHSWVSDHPDEEFVKDFPHPSPELVDWFADQGGVLMGFDSASVDDFNSKHLPGHHRLRERGLAWLELLYLANVPDGQYELVALPLKFEGLCASPVRAILRTLP